MALKPLTIDHYLAPMKGEKRAALDDKEALAVLSTIAAAHTRGDLGVSASRALTDGFSLAFGVGAVFTLAGAAVALLFLRPKPPVAVHAAAEPARSEAEAAEVLAA